MKKILNLFAATLVCLLLNQTDTLASSHREAPLISTDPVADNTDVYAFRSPCDTNKMVLIANYIPFEGPNDGPNFNTFGSDVRYEIHVDNNASTPFDDVIYRFTFQQINEDTTTFFNIRLGKQNLKTTYTLERSVANGAFVPIVTNGIVPPNNIGPRSIENATVGLGVPNYDTLMNRAIMTATTGEKVFAGPIDDPFFVDLGGIFDVGNFRKDSTRDALIKFNCHSLVIEVPISTLHRAGKTAADKVNMLDSSFIIGVYASASRQQISAFDSTGSGLAANTGAWVQVSRLGMPLTNEAVIDIGNKDKWDSRMPAGDSIFAKFLKNPELALYMDTSKFANAVPGLDSLRIQQKSLGQYDFRNGRKGLFGVRNTPAAVGTAFAEAPAGFGAFLLPDSVSPRAVDLLPIFNTGVPNLIPYQLATGKAGGNPLAAGKPFINNFLPTFGDYLRVNMAVPVTPRNSPDFSSLGLIKAAVLGLTDSRFNANASLQFIPNMDGFPNGRRLEDDVTTIELQAVGGVVLAAIGLWYDDYVSGGNPVTVQLGRTLGFHAGVTKNDTTLKACFPYVQGPWRGFVGAQYAGPKSQDPLPVNVVSFTAEKEGSKVRLNWQATNEINNDRYEVEHSLDGRMFNYFGTVSAQSGTNVHNYSTVHSEPSLKGTNYYRFKQVDKDGRFTYSPIRLVKFTGKTVLTITPNPTSDIIRVFTEETNVNISVYDGNGKNVATKAAISGSTQFDISRYAKGIYMVVAEKDGVRLETTKVIKQ